MIGHTTFHDKILVQLGGGGIGVVYKVEDIRRKRISPLSFLLSRLHFRAIGRSWESAN